MSLIKLLHPVRQVKPTIHLLTDSFAEEAINDFVYSVQTSKSLDSASGTFQIQLSPAAYADFPVTTREFRGLFWKHIMPADIITIGFNSDFSFMGIVDDVTFQMQEGGSGQRTISIVGRCMGSVFQDDQVWKPQAGQFIAEWQDVINKTPALWAYYGQANWREYWHGSMQQPSNLITEIAQAFSTMNANVTVGRGDSAVKGTLKDFWIFDPIEMKDRPGDYFLDCGAINNYSAGNVWGMLQKCTDLNLYELFVDYKKGTLHTGELSCIPPTYAAWMRHRPIPYDNLYDKLTITGKKDYPTVDGLRVPGPPSIDYTPQEYRVEDFDDTKKFAWENSRTFVTNEDFHELDYDEDMISIGTSRSRREVYTMFGVIPLISSSDFYAGTVAQGVMRAPRMDNLGIQK